MQEEEAAVQEGEATESRRCCSGSIVAYHGCFARGGSDGGGWRAGRRVNNRVVSRMQRSERATFEGFGGMDVDRKQWIVSREPLVDDGVVADGVVGERVPGSRRLGAPWSM